MRCPICNSSGGFRATEYVMPQRSGALRAPGLECLECGAVVLNEGAARSDGELEAVHEAQRLRLTTIGETAHRRASQRSDRVVARRLANRG